MSFSQVIDYGSILVLVLGLIVALLSGILRDRSQLSSLSALNLSIITVFIATFGFLNILYEITAVRQIIIAIFVLVIIPYGIVFLIVWIFADSRTIERIQYMSYAGWYLSLLILFLLRLMFGWGISTDSQVIFGVFIAVTAVFDGILGGMIGLYGIEKIEKYLPTMD